MTTRKGHKYAMPSHMSNPSLSVLELNVPEPTNFKCDFTYNYYTADERTTEFIKNLPAEKLPRYIFIKWDPAKVSLNDSTEGSFAPAIPGNLLRNADKIVSENDYANPDYFFHTFSDISSIEQGAVDVENYSRISDSSAESVSVMGKEQSEELIRAGKVEDLEYSQRIPSFQQAFSALTNLPKSSLGMRILDSNGTISDEDGFLKTVLDNVSLGVKINKKVMIDVFRGSLLSTKGSNLSIFKEMHEESKGFVKNKNKTLIDPVSVKNAYTKADRKSVKILGYLIQRYEVTPSGLEKEKTFYIDGGAQSTFLDQTVLYGKEYFYSIKTVASVSILAYAYDEITPILAELYVSSKPITSSVETFEYVPPPEPEFIKFIFDYTKRNLLILWEAPTNHQGDIKQYQVFRRKSIKDPFELIAQYCFDKSDPGKNGKRYTTGELIDGNSESVPKEYAYLVHQSDVPVLVHRDEDFTVDEEFYESSEYIYAICSIDAHGMVSNYSTQYYVTFDPYKNRIMSRVISDPGAPKPYPNMKLKMDAFKDAIRFSGTAERRMNITFTPEYFKVSDDRAAIHQVIEANYPGRKDDAYYLFQMINLDNQKLETVKIKIDDPIGLTK